MIRVHALTARTSLHQILKAPRAFQPARVFTKQFSQAPCIFQNLRNVKIPPKHPKVSNEPKITPPEIVQPSKPSLVSEAYTVPNLLTISRIIGTPFIGYFIATGHSTAAVSLFAYSCITDFVDGYIARKYNLKTVLGSVLDPAADKFLMTTCTVALAIPGHMPLFVASLIIGRDVVLSLIAMYMRVRSLPPPKTMQRFLNLSIVTHSVHPNMLGKVNTALQMVYIGGLVSQAGLEALASVNLGPLFDWFGYLVAATTFTSGMTYLVGRNSFKRL